MTGVEISDVWQVTLCLGSLCSQSVFSFGGSVLGTCVGAYAPLANATAWILLFGTITSTKHDNREIQYALRLLF